MKTIKYTQDRIILLNTIAALLFPIIVNAQLNVTTGNNVGVGTTTPASKVDVEGGISIGASYSGTTAAPTNGAIIEGNVGIGTSSPGASIDVANGNYTGGSAPSILIGADIGAKTRTNSTRKLGSLTQYPYTNANSPYMLLGGDGSSGYNGVYIGGGFSGYNAATQLSFFTASSTNTTSGTERVRIDNSGNVGIGTTSIGDYLTINGGITIGNQVFGTSYNGIYLNGLTGTGNYNFLSKNGDQNLYINRPTGKEIRFNENNSCQVIIAATTGSVGIGTTSPTSILHTVASGAKTSAYSGNLLTTTATSSTASITKTGLELTSTGTWNGTSAKNIGLYVSSVTGGTNNYDAIFNGGGSVGIGTTSPGYKLDVQGGDINASGSVRSAGVALTSDQQFKINVDSLHSALTTIRQLKPKSYYFDTVNYNGTGKFNFSAAKQYGFVAQDIEQILPELVSSAVKPAITDSLGNITNPAYTYKALNYIGFISILTKGIQELQQKNDSLQSKASNQDSINNSLQNQVVQLTTNNLSMQNQVNLLVAKDTLLQNQLMQLVTTIDNCCSNNGAHSMQSPINSESQTSVKSADVKLSDVQSIVLEQNVPNPFAEQTTINYVLPDNTVKAQLLFYNAQGKLIQSTELTQKGKGQLNVFANDLSNGVYTYTLVLDGKIIESKKMVKQ